MQIHFVYVTCKDLKEAEEIGRKVVEERLAACAVTLESNKSFYWWEGKVQTEEETLLFLKTKESAVDGLIKRIQELHSYKNPCILSWPVEKGNQLYFNWVEKETRRSN